jgi:hypothetical protein
LTIPGKIRIRIPLKVWLYKRGRGGEPVKKKDRAKRRENQRNHTEETKRELIGEAEIERTKEKKKGAEGRKETKNRGFASNKHLQIFVQNACKPSCFRSLLSLLITLLL